MRGQYLVDPVSHSRQIWRNTLIELPETSVARRATVILVMAAEFRIQGNLLCVHWLMPVLFAPVSDRLQPSAEPLGHRSHGFEAFNIQKDSDSTLFRLG